MEESLKIGIPRLNATMFPQRVDNSIVDRVLPNRTFGDDIGVVRQRAECKDRIDKKKDDDKRHKPLLHTPPNNMHDHQAIELLL
jgi:hypothetical protein